MADATNDSEDRDTPKTFLDRLKMDLTPRNILWALAHLMERKLPSGVKPKYEDVPPQG